MEVNANPSLNVYNDRELPNGDIEQTLSELDKFVKTWLVSDTVKLITTAPQFYYNQKGVEYAPLVTRPKEQGCLQLILPNENANYGDLFLYSHAERMFEILAGQRSYDFITSSQF